MIRVGLTGGIGSGKTTVCNHLDKRGAKVVYADSLAKDLMQSDPKLIQQIKDAFGDQAYLADGTLNKDYLRREAFEKGEVEKLNRLVHPRVYEKIEEVMQQAERQGYAIFVYESALLLQRRKLPENLDYLVLVDAPEELRAKRVAERDGTSVESVRQRMDKQPDFSKWRASTDFLIENEASPQKLIDQAEELYQKLKKIDHARN